MDMFARSTGFEVVGLAADGEEAVAIAARTRPDAALLDVDMPHGGIPTVSRLLEVVPAMAIVMLSSDEQEKHVRSLLIAGAAAYCRKGIAPEDLAERLRRAIRLRERDPQQLLAL